MVRPVAGKKVDHIILIYNTHSTFWLKNLKKNSILYIQIIMVNNAENLLMILCPFLLKDYQK